MAAPNVLAIDTLFIAQHSGAIYFVVRYIKKANCSFLHRVDNLLWPSYCQIAAQRGVKYFTACFTVNCECLGCKQRRYNDFSVEASRC